MAESLAAILLGNKVVKKTISKYRPDDDSDGKPERDLLHTELTGVIHLVIEKNELPVFGSVKH